MEIKAPISLSILTGHSGGEDSYKLYANEWAEGSGSLMSDFCDNLLEKLN